MTGNFKSRMKYRYSCDANVSGLATIKVCTITALLIAALPQGAHAAKGSPCSDGQLKGWAKKRGYTQADCAAAAPPPNTAPALSIDSPTDGGQYTTGEVPSFSASAQDAEDGEISHQIAWSQTGSSLAAGTHQITASVTDSGGLTSSASAVITVTDPPMNTGSTELHWTVPTTREDGSPLGPTDLSGYEIYRAHEQSGSDQIITIDDPLAVSYLADGLEAGTHHFAICALDTSGLKSELSPVVSMTVDVPYQ